MQERWVCSLLVSIKHGPLCHYTHGSGQVSPICALRGSFVGDRIRVPKSIDSRNLSCTLTSVHSISPMKRAITFIFSKKMYNMSGYESRL